MQHKPISVDLVPPTLLERFEQNHPGATILEAAQEEFRGETVWYLITFSSPDGHVYLCQMGGPDGKETAIWECEGVNGRIKTSRGWVHPRSRSSQ